MLYLSKVATLLASPLGFCLVLSLCGVVLLTRGWRRSGAALALMGLVALWIAATPLAAGLALGALEARSPIRSAAETPAADIAIVLGGAVDGATEPRREPDLGEAADRILFAAALFRAGKVQRILVSGGNLPWRAGTLPEAEIIRDILVSWGIPASAIVTESGSRTTAENARMVSAMWPGLGASSALLVTSAAHMPRALATFRRAGLPVMPAATDVRAVRNPFQLMEVLPDADSLKKTSDALKEALGLVVYRLRGDL